MRSKKLIDSIVFDLIKEAGSNNIYDIIDHLGIQLIKTKRSETMFFKSNGKEVIFLSYNLHEDYVPFAIAHEIGHAVLHDAEISYYSRFSTTKTSYEREADYFAFKLLDKSIDKSLNYTISEYAKDLCVSEEVVKYVINDENNL